MNEDDQTIDTDPTDDKDSPSANITEVEANEIAMEDPGVQKHTQGLEIRKVIYVPGKLLNIVAN